MKEMKVYIPVEVDKTTIQCLSEELGKTKSMFMVSFILNILQRVHDECLETGSAVEELDKYNPCQLWPKIKVREDRR